MESKQWRPSQWKAPKIGRFMLHVNRYAVIGAQSLLGAHDGNLLAAELIVMYKEKKSEAMLRALGVRLLGDK